MSKCAHKNAKTLQKARSKTMNQNSCEKLAHKICAKNAQNSVKTINNAKIAQLK